MTDTDPHLEAAMRAYDPLGWEWFDRAEPGHPAKQPFLENAQRRMHDALRAFDQVQPKPELQRVHRPDGSYSFPDVNQPQPESEVMPHSVEECAIFERGGAPEPKRSITSGNLAHPDGCYHCKHGTQACICPGVSGTARNNNATAPVMGADQPPWLVQCMDVAFAGMTGLIEAGRLEVLRCAIAFANVQPPSDEAIKIGEDAFLEVWPGHLALPPEWRGCVRAALIKARSGA